MTLTVFSTELLKLINGNKKLKSFNSYSYTILSEVKQTYENFPLQFLGLSGKNLQEHKALLISDVKKADSKAFHQHLQEYKADCRKYKQHNEYVKIQSFLNSSIWNEWYEANRISSAKILDIEQFWEANKYTSHLTSESLQIIGTFILPVFEHFYQAGSAELHSYGKKLTEQARSEVQYYLKKLSAEIEEEKLKICEAMLSRLEIASREADASFDDVTEYTLKILKEIGITVDLKTTTRHGLDGKSFSYFHQYVFLNANFSQKERLKNLRWLKDDNQFFSQRVDEQWLLIPDRMKNCGIPTSSKKTFLWFNRWHNFKANFFKEHFQFLSKCKLLDEKNYSQPYTLESLLEGKAWRHLVVLGQACWSEHHKSLRFTSSRINKLFFRYKSDFYTNWDECNMAMLGKILENKIKFATKLASELNTRLALGLDQAILQAKSTKMLLVDIIADIEKTFGQLNIANTLEWCSIKNTFTNVFNYKGISKKKNDEDNAQRIVSTFKIIDQLSTPAPSLVEKIHSEKITAVSQSPLVKLNRQLFNLTKEDVFNLSHPNFVSHLAGLESELTHSQPVLNAKELKAFWVNFFCIYLRTALLAKDAEQNVLGQAGSLLIKYAPDNIRERVIVMEEKKAKSSRSVYQTCCKALLFSFNQELENGTCDEQLKSLSPN